MQLNNLLWDESVRIYNDNSNILSTGRCNGNVIVIKSRQYGTYIFKGMNSKNLLKQFIKDNPEYKHIAQVNNNDGYRQFLAIKNWKDLLELINYTENNKRYFYELILSDNYCKPYLDIEWKIKDNESVNHEDFILKLKSDIMFIFKNRYNIDINNSHILIAECHRNNKVSFHVILNIVIDNCYYAFKTNRKGEYFSAYDLYLALIEHDINYKSKIDKSVYSLDREFRTILSVKYGEQHAFKPINNNTHINYLDYFITYFNDNYLIQQIIKN